MKNAAIILFVIIAANFTLAQSNDAEKESIKKVIQESYIDGVFNDGNAVAAKKGVHYDCDIIVFEDGKMRKVPAYSYVERIEKKPGGLYPGTSCSFTEINVTGYAAMAIVEIYRDNGWHNYTDYLSLYKFEDGWKVVSRIAYSYPKD